MDTIIFLNTQKSGSSRQAIKIAENMGYFTVLFTDRLSRKYTRDEYPDVHLLAYCEDLSNIENMIKKIEKLQVKGFNIKAIISFVDHYCHIAAVLAEHFKVGRFTTSAIGKMENKISSIKAIENSDYAPWHKSVFERNDISLTDIQNRFPLILKSPCSTGSKDVYKVGTLAEFVSSFEQLRLDYPKEPVLIEEFLDGPQYLVEVVVYDKDIRIIAIFKQDIEYIKRFIVMGYSFVANQDDPKYKGLTKAVRYIVDCHGLKAGTCHLEMRYVKNNWKLVEINPRISGAGMNNMIINSTGINLVEETLKMALGEQANFKPKIKKNLYAQYITVSKPGILERVSGRNRAHQCDGVVEVYVKPRRGSYLEVPTSMGHRYAYVIATGDTEEGAKQNAKYAASQIEFNMREETQ